MQTQCSCLRLTNSRVNKTEHWRNDLFIKQNLCRCTPHSPLVVYAVLYSKIIEYLVTQLHRHSLAQHCRTQCRSAQWGSNKWIFGHLQWQLYDTFASFALKLCPITEGGSDLFPSWLRFNCCISPSAAAVTGWVQPQLLIQDQWAFFAHRFTVSTWKNSTTNTGVGNMSGCRPSCSMLPDVQAADKIVGNLIKMATNLCIYQ